MYRSIDLKLCGENLLRKFLSVIIGIRVSKVGRFTITDIHLNTNAVATDAVQAKWGPF